MGFLAVGLERDEATGVHSSITKPQSVSGTAVAMKARDITLAMVLFYSGSLVMISSMRLAIRAFTDCPAPYFEMYFAT